MKISDKQLKELRSCELYQSMLPRNQKIVEWMIREYIKLAEEENIKVKIHFVTPMEDGSIKIDGPKEEQVNRRRLLNLNSLGFNFGLYFISDAFMPFFGEKEIGLFEVIDDMSEVENGDICLLIDKIENKYWLATKEETGFFTLDCKYLDNGEALALLGKLVNIETK